jgi:hypothetical protein
MSRRLGNGIRLSYKTGLRLLLLLLLLFTAIEFSLGDSSPYTSTESPYTNAESLH